MVYDEVANLIPQIYPFRFIDRIIDTDEEKFIKCIKNVTYNEYYFQGHFPGKPILPGVILIEAAAQSAILLYMKKYKKNKERIDFLLKKSEMDFLKPITPGDTIVFEIRAIKIVESAGIVEVKCWLNEEIVAKGKLVFAVIER